MFCRCVCGDRTRYFQSKHEVFLTLTKLPTLKRWKMNLKKHKVLTCLWSLFVLIWETPKVKEEVMILSKTEVWPCILVLKRIWLKVNLRLQILFSLSSHWKSSDCRVVFTVAVKPQTDFTCRELQHMWGQTVCLRVTEVNAVKQAGWVCSSTSAGMLLKVKVNLL